MLSNRFAVGSFWRLPVDPTRIVFAPSNVRPFSLLGPHGYCRKYHLPAAPRDADVLHPTVVGGRVVRPDMGASRLFPVQRCPRHHFPRPEEIVRVERRKEVVPGKMFFA